MVTPNTPNIHTSPSSSSSSQASVIALKWFYGLCQSRMCSTGSSGTYGVSVCVCCVSYILPNRSVCHSPPSPFVSYGIKRLFAVRANVFNEMVQVASRNVRKLLLLLLLWSMNIVCAYTHIHTHELATHRPHMTSKHMKMQTRQIHKRSHSYWRSIITSSVSLSISFSPQPMYVDFVFFCFHFKSCALCCCGYYSALETLSVWLHFLFIVFLMKL